MVIIKNFKIALVVGSIMTMAFVVSSCAKPIDELVQIDETKKIVKKTTNINRDEDGNIKRIASEMLDVLNVYVQK